MDNLDLLIKFHLDNPRQGPGGLAETLRAIELSGLRDRSNLKIADIGCGTGASTLVLAKELVAQIRAIDLFPQFMDVLNSRANHQHIGSKISTEVLSMDNLSFKPGELDAIWSEGAIYNIGFRQGVYEWRKFLKPGGVLAVSEITWITDTRPEEIERYWSQEYSEINTASKKIGVLEEAGYKILGYFPLHKSCWLDNYYKPMKEKFESFLNREQNSKEAMRLVEQEKHEISIFERFGDYYSYGFYIAERLK